MGTNDILTLDKVCLEIGEKATKRKGGKEENSNVKHSARM
jgi:hypothetical protein